MLSIKMPGWASTDKLAIELQRDGSTYYMFKFWMPYGASWHEETHRDFFEAYIERRAQCMSQIN